MSFFSNDVLSKKSLENDYELSLSLLLLPLVFLCTKVVDYLFLNSSKIYVGLSGIRN